VLLFLFSCGRFERPRVVAGLVTCAAVVGGEPTGG
jgi:hypothetical protein